MDIKLYLIALASRREMVFEELQHPVFSLIKREPLPESWTFISYASLQGLSKQKHLIHLSSSVLEDYVEVVE